MSRVSLQQPILEPWDMRSVIARAGRAGSPVVAVVAGSGLVARCAREAEADILLALSAGFFRSLGTGSLASFMPFANSNELTERVLREQILPSRNRLPVIGGVCATDPSRPLTETLRRLHSLGAQGITNWPAVGFIDGTIRQAIEAEGWGVDAEVALLEQAHTEGLSAFGFALEAEAAGRFAGAGADALILDVGLTRQLDDVREHADHLQRAILRLQEMLFAVKATGKRPLLLCFGGPITTAEDLEQIFRQCEIDGFAGGSVFERLPVHEVVTSAIRRFKNASIHVGSRMTEVGMGELIGATPEMKEIFRFIRQIAPHEANVCIEGETGTGKELVANLLHRYSSRNHGPLVTVNCGAIPESLLESELFGHEKGSFTGAHRQRIGKFELARRGTLFLDEIADLSPHGQVALLRAIQQREITRVGGETTIPVDVRILSASNRSLADLVQDGRFRADLFYRLNHVTVRMPPLRERKADIPLLCESILTRVRAQLKGKTLDLGTRFLEKLNQHSWPGNVRELEHVLRQAALLEEASVISGRFFTPQPLSLPGLLPQRTPILSLS